MRKLASVQKVSKVSPIPNADRIELVTINGWEVISKKDELKEGELCVYFEIDSMLPLNQERFALLKKGSNVKVVDGIEYARLRTIKLRGQLSQGLALPLSMFESVPNLEEGDDLTTTLGVLKYQPPGDEDVVNTSTKARNPNGKFPSFIRKTDQERIQNLVHHLDAYKYETFEVSVKLDGSSCTIFVVDNKSSSYDEACKILKVKPVSVFSKLFNKVLNFFTSKKIELSNKVYGICSRNLAYNENDTSTHFVRYIKDIGILDKIKSSNLSNVALQGELIAPNIQNNFEKVNKPEFYLFDVWDIEKNKYWTPFNTRLLATDLDIPHVPVLHVNYTLNYKDTNMETMQDILNMAEGQGLNPGVNREGIVFKSNSNTGISFKAISNSYLLYKKD